jgi:hypothetical protein
MSNFKGVTTLVLIAFVAVSVLGCTTMMMNPPLSVQDQKDTYMFKIGLGGFSGDETSFAKLQYELDQFQNDHGYKNHKIIDKKRSYFPMSYYEYTIKFFRE